ncbi:MAG TPA: putative inorganic carbon transporter subunit DabA, partial [Pirellulales bacterium]|nr:putative inorganic carbon transporter subunit DabA [Pirellulales bacterium]
MPHSTLPRQTRSAASDERKSRRAHLNSAIERAGDLLPMPGPITAFGFLNTLQALEDLPFDEGLRKGARLHGCQPYLPEERYRERMSHGRIQVEDLEAVLREDLGDEADAPIASLTTRCELRLAMLQHSLPYGPREELRWFVAETETLARLREQAPLPVRQRFVEETRRWVMRDLRGNQSRDPGRRMLAELVRRFGESSIERWSPQTWKSLTLHALWRVCCEGVRGLEAHEDPVEAPVRHRDALLAACGEDSDVLVHEVLIRFCAAFADQGLASWPLPNREQGFFRAFCSLYGQPGGSPQRWLRGLPQELSRLQKANLGPIESIEESLALLGVAEDQWDDFIVATLLALRGWAGMLWQMEVRSDRVPQPAPQGTLAEFLAVRLILERLALAHVAGQSLDYRGTLDGLAEAARARSSRREPTNFEQRALLAFHLAQALGWSPPRLHQLKQREWAELIAEIEQFSELERRWTFHQAYERRFRTQALDAMAAHGRRPVRRTAAPKFQISFCIDAREESFRRHLEEISRDTETFGAPGFYGVAMYYRGAADAHFSALCPIVVKPQHWVVEDVVYTFEETHRRRAKTRRALGTASHQVHVGSRGIAGGWLLTAGIGVLASAPLLARVLFPRLTARIRRTAGRFMQAPSMTRLRL